MARQFSARVTAESKTEFPQRADGLDVAVSFARPDPPLQVTLHMTSKEAASFDVGSSYDVTLAPVKS